MADDLLQSLLRDADASSGTPATSPLLADRVRARLARQQRRRRAMTAAAGVVVIFICLASMLRPRDADVRKVAHVPQDPHVSSVPPEVVPAAAPPPVDDHRELERLSLAAAVAERTAERLLAAAAARPQKRKLPAATASELQFERDRTALVLVYEGERHARESRPAAAVASYRRAIELFPRTHWADVARQRLKQMQT